MKGSLKLRVGARTDEGLQRTHNEDTYFSDPEHGFFGVIDGVGGQNAGEVAAETARKELLARLERQDGTIEQALREGITFANNKIFQASRGHPELKGMACVLSAAVVAEGSVHIGHVGDSRIYKVRRGQIVKLTHDHSPVGEREDRGELTEQEAMRHVRRNEVYRDIGSEPHQADDADFIEYIHETFDADAALVLCSDGLSDLVTSAHILETVMGSRGNPQQTAESLVQLALDAGGKDNVTVLVVEGPEFAPTLPLTRSGTVIPPYLQPLEGEEPTSRLADRQATDPGEKPTLKLIWNREPARNRDAPGALPAQPGAGSASGGDRTAPPDPRRSGEISPSMRGGAAQGSDSSRRVIPLAKGETTGPVASRRPRPGASPATPLLARLPGWVLPLMTMTIGALGLLLYLQHKTPPPTTKPVATPVPEAQPDWVRRMFQPGSDLNEAIANTRDYTVLVIPKGEYSSFVKLKSKVKLVAADPWTVVFNPVGGAPGSEEWPAVDADEVLEAGLYGIVVGKPDSPRKLGIRLKNSDVELVDVIVRGTTKVGIEVEGARHPILWQTIIEPNAGEKVKIAPMSEVYVQGEPSAREPLAPVPPRGAASDGSSSGAEKAGGVKRPGALPTEKSTEKSTEKPTERPPRTPGAARPLNGRGGAG